MSKHTPTPWDVEGTTIYASRNRGEEICYVAGYDEAHPECREEKSEDENEANAVHIVKCVNEREDLVRFVEIVAAGYSLADKCNELTNCEHELWDIARALLDKVGSADLDQ